jgi:hypothetical protein
MQAASLAVAMIGQAQARGLVTKHAVKQVDRLLSNEGIDVWDCFARWVPYQIGERWNLLVAMDWTDFAHDDQATLVLSLVTGHGRAAVVAQRLEGRTDEAAQRFRGCLPVPPCRTGAGWMPRDNPGRPRR